MRIAKCLLFVAVLAWPGEAGAERRVPFGNDAGLLEARVREDIERRVTPALNELAPGQAELKYVDVRVNRPHALPTGASPGFEDLTPGAAEYVAERAEVSLLLDAKLPLDFRKNLRNLLKNRLEGLGVPIEIKETVMVFPAPRPQPQPPSPREMMPYYPPPPPAAAPPPPATAPPAPQAQTAPPPPVPQPQEKVAGDTALTLLLAIALGILAFLVLREIERRARARETAVARGGGNQATPIAQGSAADSLSPAPPDTDRLPEVRRALTEDRVLARRVLGELLRRQEHEKVARTVELVGPGVIEDLRGDPAHATSLRQAAALLDGARPLTAVEARRLGDELYRRMLKHRMMGADDPVEQEFAYLTGLPRERFAAVLAGERPAARAAALRYAPAHLRAGYLADLPSDERNSLVAALADPKAPTKDYLLDVATTLRARALDHAHVGAGDSNDVELLIEMIEDQADDEQAALLDTMRRLDPAKWRRVQGALVTDGTFGVVEPDVLGAAAMTLPAATLAAFLRGGAPAVAERTLASLPAPMAAGLREELDLEIHVAVERSAEARRAMSRALRAALRERGLSVPAGPAGKSERGKVVAI